MFKPVNKINSTFKDDNKVLSSFGVLINKTLAWLYGSANVTYGQDRYTYGGTTIETQDNYRDRDKITTNWK